MRQESGWLARNGGPGVTAIRALINAGRQIGYANIDRLGGMARRAGARVKNLPHNPIRVAKIDVACFLDVVALGCKAGNLGPGGAKVGALPQTVAAPGAEQ